MKLAVIVVSYNVRELLRACLTTTFASLSLNPDIDATVWVVDNASVDDSAAMVAAEFPQVRLIASQENLGFAGGNNFVLRKLGFSDVVAVQATRAGTANFESRISIDESGNPQSAIRNPQSAIRNSSGRLGASMPDFALLLNPDAEPVGDAIGQMAAFLAGHPEVGGAGAQLAYPDGRFQHGAFCFPGLLQLWFDLFPPRPRRLLDSRLNGRYPASPYRAGYPFPIDFALGAALMVRREAIAQAGLLDEGYFMYAEEVDWCWRIQRAGWPFYCVPTARVIHHGGASTRQFRTASFQNLWRSRLRLYQRFYGPLRRRLAGWLVRIGMRAAARQAQRAVARGEIDGDEAAQRISAAREVGSQFRVL